MLFKFFGVFTIIAATDCHYGRKLFKEREIERDTETESKEERETKRKEEREAET